MSNALKSLPKPSAQENLERLRRDLNIEDHMYDPIQKDKLDNESREFSHYSKQVLPFLKNMQKDVAFYMNNNSKCITNYRNFLNMLDNYEKLNLTNYVEGDDTKMVFLDKNSNINISTVCENMKNPYFNIYHWVKGEIFDIEAVMFAITTKDKTQKTIQDKIKAKKSKQDDLDNVTQGRKTVKTLFKNQNDTGAMVNKIEQVSTKNSFSWPWFDYTQTDKEIEALQQMFDVISIYIG